MYCSTFSFILLRTSPVAKIVCRIMSLSDQIYLQINGNVCKLPVTERIESCGKVVYIIGMSKDLCWNHSFSMRIDLI